MLIFYLLILPDIPLPSDLLLLWVPSPGGRNHRYAHGPWLAATGCCLPHPCRDGSSFKCLRIIGPSAAPLGWVFGLPSWAVQDLHVFQGPQGLLGWEDRSFSNPRPLLPYSQTTGWGGQNGPHSWHCIYTHSDLLWLSPNTSKCSCLLELPSPGTRENICREGHQRASSWTSTEGSHCAWIWGGSQRGPLYAISQGMSDFITQGENIGFSIFLCSSPRKLCVRLKQNLKQNPGTVLGKYIVMWDGGEDSMVLLYL